MKDVWIDDCHDHRVGHLEWTLARGQYGYGCSNEAKTKREKEMTKPGIRPGLSFPAWPDPREPWL
jgi:hypothetical protein